MAFDSLNPFLTVPSKIPPCHASFILFQELFGDFSGPGGQARRTQAWEAVFSKGKELGLATGKSVTRQLFLKNVVENTIRHVRGGYKTVTHDVLPAKTDFCVNCEELFEVLNVFL